MGQKKLSRYKFIFLLLTLMFLPSIGASAQKHITSHVTVTCYQPVKSQCDSKPLVTAEGISRVAKSSGAQFQGICYIFFQRISQNVYGLKEWAFMK